MLADVGHDLNVISEQDTNDYASTQWQASGKVVIGYGSGASGSISAGKVDSHYASVTEASGIQAGAGGYQVHVGDTTHLVGGQLASTADPSKNLLDTGNLNAESVHNESKYNAVSVSVSVSGGTGAMAGGGGGLSTQSHDASSDTQSGIAAGTVLVRDGSVQGELNQNQTVLDANGIKNGFDAQRVAEQQELGSLAGYVGMRAAGHIASAMQSDAAANGDAAQAKAWSDGGADKTVLHAVVGAATAALGGGDALQGAVGAGASEAASPYLQAGISRITSNPAAGNALMDLGSTLVGGMVGGGAGASTALSGELYNRQLHPWETSLAAALAAKSNGQYTKAQIEDALRNSSYGNSSAPVVNPAMGDNTLTSNGYVPAGTGETLLSWSFYSQNQSGTIDPGASFSFSPSLNPGLFGYANDAVATQNMPALNYSVANFIAANMSDPAIQATYGSHFASNYGNWQYTWQTAPTPAPAPTDPGYVPQQQGVNGNNMTFYDAMLGRVVTIGVSGVCGTAECVMNAGNFDMSDPRTQQYVSDVAHKQAAVELTIASVASGMWWSDLAAAGSVPSWLAYGGAGATSAASNATGQYLQTGEVRVPDVLISAVAGTGVGWAARLPGWQAPLATLMINTGANGANTWLDNAAYGENNSIPDAMLSSAFGTVFGYQAGDKLADKGFNPWIINSVANPLTESATRATGSGISYLNSLISQQLHSQSSKESQDQKK